MRLFHGKDWPELNAKQRETIKLMLIEVLRDEMNSVEEAINAIIINANVPIRVRIHATIEELN